MQWTDAYSEKRRMNTLTDGAREGRRLSRGPVSLACHTIATAFLVTVSHNLKATLTVDY